MALQLFAQAFLNFRPGKNPFFLGLLPFLNHAFQRQVHHFRLPFRAKLAFELCVPRNRRFFSQKTVEGLLRGVRESPGTGFRFEELTAQDVELTQAAQRQV
ncbi:hypothetical protein Amal_03920 [Acetobacter malorum]|uniref:Uncharacterized protein n=1 Tax=Acetobacter malorum TaxID=178901 RepID=A0A177G3H2_9PROT|nr:hypothetical protein Amal_03920 [Acetobacter malorum]